MTESDLKRIDCQAFLSSTDWTNVESELQRLRRRVRRRKTGREKYLFWDLNPHPRRYLDQIGGVVNPLFRKEDFPRLESILMSLWKPKPGEHHSKSFIGSVGLYIHGIWYGIDVRIPTAVPSSNKIVQRRILSGMRLLSELTFEGLEEWEQS